MAKKKSHHSPEKNKSFRLKARYLPYLAILALVLIFFNLIFFFLTTHAFPRTFINNTNVSFLSQNEIINLLSSQITPPQAIRLVDDQKVYDLPISDIDFSYDFPKTASLALKPHFYQKNLSLDYSLNSFKLDQFLKENLINTSPNPAIFPQVKLVDQKITFSEGKEGNAVDQQTLKSILLQNLSHANFSDISITYQSINPTLTDDEKETLSSQGQKLIDKKIIFDFEFDHFTYKDLDLIDLLTTTGFNHQKIDDLAETITQKINRPTQNAKFVITADNKVSEFAPAKTGIALDKEKFINDFNKNLNTLLTTDETQTLSLIPVFESQPQVKTADVNNLGINTLIGRGTSRYVGSIEGRKYNISLAASRINGTLVAPGETLSFNSAVGDVSVLTGYKQAYIIQNGATILGDGGGLCQVSTTLFRAALNAGLPILERRAHSYRVGYYEQDSKPGLDATVYSPTTDLKIKNDTDHYLLIQATANLKASTLVFEIYGTPDGRQSQVGIPVILSTTPAPEDLYIDDPTLPAGTIKQIDHKANGAKVQFTYKVIKNGETIINKTFKSNYQPWQAKFLRGTGPAI